MSNNDQNQKSNVTPAVTAAPAKSGADKAAMFTTEVKKAWNKLSDDEIRLYETDKDAFFAKLKEKHSVSKEDAQKRIAEIKTECGNCSTEKAA